MTDFVEPPEGLMPGGGYFLLLVVNDVPERSIAAGDWVLVDQKGGADLDQVVAYVGDDQDVQVGVLATVLEHDPDATVLGRVIFVIRPVDTEKESEG